MNPDTLKKFVVQIEYCIDKEIVRGSGVIFKPEKSSQYAYVFTAKHNFFKGDKDDEAYYKNILDIDHNHLKITREVNKEKNIKIKGSVYFIDYIKDKSVDFSFLVIDLFENKINDVSYLEIEDSIDENYNIKNTEFSILGYPSHSEERNTNKIQPHIVKYSQNTFDETYSYREEFRDFENTIELDIKDEISGLSGGGVFIQGKDNEKLRSILVEVTRHDTFICIKLDHIIDTINKRIKKIAEKNEMFLHEVQCGDKIFIDKEELDFSEYSNFEFFKKRIEKDKNFQSFCKDNTIEINNEISNNLKRKIKNEKISLEKQRKGLSFVYARLAILSHKNKNRRATTMYFKQAIELNEEHKTVLLLEKDTRNKENINKLETESLEEKVGLLYNSINKENEKEVLIEIIETFDFYKSKEEKSYNDKTYFKENTYFFEDKIDEYIIKIREVIISDDTIRLHYRYKKLSEIFYRLENKKFKEKSFYYLFISKIIALDLEETEVNKSFLTSIEKTIKKFTRNEIIIDKNKVKEEANKALSEKEEYFQYKTKEMIHDIYNRELITSDDISSIDTEINTIKRTIIDMHKITNDSVGYIDDSISSVDGKLSEIEKTNNSIHGIVDNSWNCFNDLNKINQHIEESENIQKNNMNIENKINNINNDLKEYNTAINKKIDEDFYLLKDINRTIDRFYSGDSFIINNASIKEYLEGILSLKTIEIKKEIKEKQKTLIKIIKNKDLDKGEVKRLNEEIERQNIKNLLEMRNLFEKNKELIEVITKRKTTSINEIKEIVTNINKNTIFTRHGIIRTYSNLIKTIALEKNDIKNSSTKNHVSTFNKIKNTLAKSLLYIIIILLILFFSFKFLYSDFGINFLKSLGLL